jgi:hypothetical protein
MSALRLDRLQRATPFRAGIGRLLGESGARPLESSQVLGRSSRSAAVRAHDLGNKRNALVADRDRGSPTADHGLSIGVTPCRRTSNEGHRDASRVTRTFVRWSLRFLRQNQTGLSRPGRRICVLGGSYLGWSGVDRLSVVAL